jgi:hypothetical protein
VVQIVLPYPDTVVARQDCPSDLLALAHYSGQAAPRRVPIQLRRKAALGVLAVTKHFPTRILVVQMQPGFPKNRVLRAPKLHPRMAERPGLPRG